MLLRLQKGLPAEPIAAVLALATELGLKARFLDEHSEILSLEGPGRPEHRSKFEDLCGVRSVIESAKL